jgi:hypothetical protein
MLVSLIVVGAVVLAAVVAYKLFKSGKAVTASSVIAGAEADVKSAASAAETAAKADVSKI